MTEPAAVSRPSASADPVFADLIEELTEKFHHGEPVDVEAYLNDHPAYTEELRQLLPALRMLADVSRSGAVSSIPNIADAETGTLGDFRLLREVGRGGMGVVYEAEQISLGRRVALKVLPFAATMDPRHLQRFQNEARAAASLEHPHIVPVHGVGCERGVHYYAMKFIDGQTVAALIADQRQDSTAAKQPAQAHSARMPTADTSPPVKDTTTPTPRDAAYFRRAAEWGIQAAQALEHAHSLGIVHRDIKPGNLMIDAQGKLWVTDFGLARTATDTGLTMTGDVLGTLRYMSPEQAQASHGLVDHRTDVYSLGVTLYELLTLWPAFEGEDRAKLLQRICLEEPVTPRRIDRAIPAELETIVLKAMEKNPADRYATAQEMAEDLRRFLMHEPIRAKRASTLQWVRKWTRRHRTLVGAGVATLALTAVVSAVSTFLVWRAYQAEATQRQQADQNYQAAKEQRRQARQAVDDMYTQVAEKLLARSGLTDVEHDFLRKALGYYEQFAQEDAAEPSERAARGDAYHRVAHIYWKLQEYDKSVENYRKGTAVYETLVEEFPENPDYQLCLARTCYGLSWILGSRGAAEAETVTRRSIDLLENLVAKYPDHPQYRVWLAGSLERLGYSVLHFQGRDREGEPFLHKAISVLQPLVDEKPPDSRALLLIATHHNLMTDMLREQSRFQEMAEHIRSSVRYWEKLMSNPVGDPEYEHNMQPYDWLLSAQAYLTLGEVLTRAEDFDGAGAALERSQAIADKLSADFPKVPTYPEHLTFVYEKRAFLAAAMNRPQEAEEQYRRAIEVTEKTIAAFPQMPGHPGYLARLLLRTPYPRLRNPQRALELAKKVLVEFPDRPDLWTHLGMAHHQVGNWKDAAASFEKAVQLSKGGDTETWYYLAMTYAKMGDRPKAEEWHQRAAVSMRDEHKSKDKELLRLKAEAEEVLRSLDSPRTEVKEGSPRKN